MTYRRSHCVGAQLNNDINIFLPQHCQSLMQRSVISGNCEEDDPLHLTKGWILSPNSSHLKETNHQIFRADSICAKLAQKLQLLNVEFK